MSKRLKCRLHESGEVMENVSESRVIQQLSILRHNMEEGVERREGKEEGITSSLSSHQEEGTVGSGPWIIFHMCTSSILHMFTVFFRA